MKLSVADIRCWRLFEGSSYGYRPRRSQHQCLDALGRTIQQGKVNHVVEADICGFFNEVNHDWMTKFLELRIGDPRIKPHPYVWGVPSLLEKPLR
jgi:retron-type reverse transcriptase